MVIEKLNFPSLTLSLNASRQIRNFSFMMTSNNYQHLLLWKTLSVAANSRIHLNVMVRWFHFLLLLLRNSFICIVSTQWKWKSGEVSRFPQRKAKGRKIWDSPNNNIVSTHKILHDIHYYVTQGLVKLHKRWTAP